ncbi:MAG: ABC transporter permease [Acidobacteriota bacterium]
MEAFKKDFIFSLRSLIKKPGFTLIAIFTLALGIGANTAIFSVINAVLLRALPYKDPDRLAMIWETSQSSQRIHVSHLNFIDWREQSHSFEAMSACSGRWGGQSTVTGGVEPLRAHTAMVYRDFFSTLGVNASIGRTFLPRDHNLGAAPSVVISHALWQRSLGGDPNLEGKTLNIGGISVNVIGVMPQGFSFPPETDVWAAKEALSEDTSARSAHNFRVIARLKADVTVSQAQTEMNTIAARLSEQYPEMKDKGAAVISLEDQMVGSVRPALMILMAAVGFVLLIACANVANLLLARALSREKEIAIRAALGASRLRIIRQLLTESLLLALAGGALGLMLAYWLVEALISLSPPNIYRIEEVGIDRRALLFTLAVSLATSLIFGLAPALKASRTDLQESLKSAGKGAMSGAGSKRMRNALVVTEVALTVVLLAGAGLLTKSFWLLLQVDPGFKPEGVLTMQLSLPQSDYESESKTIAFYDRLLPQLTSLAGVETAGMINNLPLGGVNINGQFLIEGRPDDRGYGGFRIVSRDYFRALGIPLLRGRFFSDSDDMKSMPVAIIDRSVAEKSWPGEEAIGKRIRSGMDRAGDVWMTIIGIVGDVRQSGLDADTYPAIYVPYTQRPYRAREMTIVARASIDPSALIAAARREVAQIDKNLPVSFDSLSHLLSKSTASRRYNMILLGAFAAFALMLSMVGIYGVMSYSVTQSTREIGIRMALGADQKDVLKMVMTNGLAMSTAGIAIGLGMAVGLTRLMASLLYKVSATDAMVLSVAPMLIILVALLACWVPARRAMKVDPQIALRYE